VLRRAFAALPARLALTGGHLIRSTFSVAGGALAGSQVIDGIAPPSRPIRRCPLRSDRSRARDEEAGGDKRGKQSAALLVHDDQDYQMRS
jgi:uncharacterized Ntn-hydrolase superfamily protein